MQQRTVASKKLKNDNEIDIKASLSWTRDKNITSGFECFSVQQQEISTKYLIEDTATATTYYRVTINVDSAKILLKPLNMSLVAVP